jgi:hypothetical protein
MIIYLLFNTKRELKIIYLIIKYEDYSFSSNSRESKFILMILTPEVIKFVCSVQLFFPSGSFLLSIFALE